MSVVWTVQPPAPKEATAALRESLGLHPLVADILVRRGVDSPEAAALFLQPSLEQLHDPFLFKGMQQAVETIADALRAGRRIVISGDYDVDGITATALLFHFLRACGCSNLEYFIPNRFHHGYGLTSRSIDALLELSPDIVITVDNGITAVDEVTRLQAAGIATIVTDHHLPREQGVPPGIVVNPQQTDCGYPFKGISGCGVAFKLAMALRKHLRDLGWWTETRPEPNLRAYLDIAAIGTVADVVPLIDENRAIVRHGLAVMNETAQRPGLAALIALTRLEQVTASGIAFRIAPRINAAGRMSEGALGVQLLLAEDADEAAALAAQLDEENNRRRAKGEQMMKDALNRIQSEGLDSAPGIVVASEDFHEGIIGIVASRLTEKFHRPAVVLAENGSSFKGSARSVPGFNVTEAIAACSHLLQEYGGHAGAGGCKLPKENLIQFREAFANACGRIAEDSYGKAVAADGILVPGDCDPALVEQIQRMEPFGHENEEPQFLVAGEHIGEPPSRIGTRHLKWKVSPEVDMIGWGMAGHEHAESAQQFLVRLEFNEYRGRRTIQMIVTEMSGEPYNPGG